MSVITLPATLRIAHMTWSQQRLGIASRSAFGMQTVESSPPVWAVTIEGDRDKESDTGAWKALVLQLRGATNQLAVWDIARPAPLGTLRGSLTFGATAAQGDTAITIDSGMDGLGKTLVAGDLIGFGSELTQQVVMATQDVMVENDKRSLALDFAAQEYYSGVPGQFQVTVEPPLRNAFAAGAAITWDKPKALFRNQSQRVGWDYESSFASGFTLDLIEDWRP